MRILKKAGEVVLGDEETKLHESHGPEADELRRLMRRAAHELAESLDMVVYVRASAKRGGYTIEEVAPASFGPGRHW